MSGLADLPSLGPTSAAMLEEVGIETPEALREAGAVFAYKILRFRFGPTRVNPLFLFSLHAALTGRHWSQVSAEEKARLRADAQAGDLDVGPA